MGTTLWSEDRSLGPRGKNNGNGNPV